MSKRGKAYRSTLPYYNVGGAPYALLDCVSLTQSEVDALREGTNAMNGIFEKMAIVLRESPSEVLIELGFHKEMVPFLQTRYTSISTSIARDDWCMADGQIKLYERNSDTPTFIVECLRANGAIAKRFRFTDPNANETKKLKLAIRRAVWDSMKWLAIPYNPNIVFVAHPGSQEDWETVKFLYETAAIPGSKLMPIGNVRVDDQGVYDDTNRPIDILYRQTYPIEYLFEDRTQDGLEIGKMVMDHVINQRLAIINPPSAFLIQAKAILALVWGIAEEEEQNIFTMDEVAAIKKYMLPTYLEADSFLGRCKFVRKPSFGREGDTVQIFHADGTLDTEDVNKNYQQHVAVYQEFKPLPKRMVKTPFGKQKAHVLFGVFSIGGEASAIGVRAASTQITDNRSWFVPVGMCNSDSANIIDVRLL